MFFNSIIGQENQNEYNFVPIDDGFTQSAITSILKDNEGFTWIGTYSDGLFKYNSISLKSSFALLYKLRPSSVPTQILYW